MQQPLVTLSRQPVVDLRERASLPSVFEAQSVLDVRQSSGGFEPVQRLIEVPSRRNYDRYEGPLTWSRDFDTTAWDLISAFVDERRIGGIIVAAGHPGVALFEGRTDPSGLWDLRVASAYPRLGIATTLCRAARKWAQQRGCIERKVETQNTNPAACKFYLHNGFVLFDVRPGAYRELPDDVQLIWRMRLDG